MNSRRTQKLSEQIRNTLALLCLTEVSDPALVDVTLTGVSVTGDLRLADVFFLHHQKKSEDVIAGFKRATPFFRRRLGEILSLRHVPELRFQYDKHTEETQHLMQLFEQLPTPS